MNKLFCDSLINTINDTKKDIIIAGLPGTGKTTVINNTLTYNEDSIIFNGTLKDTEYLCLRENNIFDLYHVCLIIKKILLKIKKNYLDKYMINFVFFDIYINNIIKQIYDMSMTDIYEKETSLINKEIIDTPEILLDKLFSLISKELDIKVFSLIIDDFDKIGEGSQRYQELIYNRLKSYLRLIITISDKNIVNNLEKMQEFSIDNEVIKLDYSNNIEIVRKILNEEVRNNFIKTRKVSMTYNLYFILNDDTIELMIKKTNGNLFDMLNAIRYLYSNIEELDRSEYSTFILNYIDDVINKNPILTGIIMPKRKLYIKP